MAIDFDSFTLGEIVELEDLSGVPVSQFADETRPRGRMMAALAYIIRKREDSTFTFTDALNLKANELAEFNGEDDESPKEETNASAKKRGQKN
jgi:hypothetical protein